MSQALHKSVLLEASVDALVTDTAACYVDGTFGRGGHTQAILGKLAAQGRVVAFDQDLSAIEYGQRNFKTAIKSGRLTLVHANFANLRDKLAELNLVGRVQGVLLDIGVSSPQLDEADRGFSFMKPGPLDMRMDQTQGLTALEKIQQTEEGELARVLKSYGEERQAWRDKVKAKLN